MPNSFLTSKLPVVVPKKDRLDQEEEGQGTTFYKLPSDFHFKPTLFTVNKNFIIFIEKIGSQVALCIIVALFSIKI